MGAFTIMDSKQKQEVIKSAPQVIGEMWTKIATLQIPWFYLRISKDNE